MEGTLTWFAGSCWIHAFTRPQHLIPAAVAILGAIPPTQLPQANQGIHPDSIRTHHRRAWRTEGRRGPPRRAWRSSRHRMEAWRGEDAEGGGGPTCWACCRAWAHAEKCRLAMRTHAHAWTRCMHGSAAQHDPHTRSCTPCGTAPTTHVHPLHTPDPSMHLPPPTTDDPRGNRLRHRVGHAQGISGRAAARATSASPGTRPSRHGAWS
jgi:hypothetical protein